MDNNLNKYFLPYQQRWLDDNSPVKIWEKSRRIGATYVQSYEDVRDCVSKKVPSVWFSSADESAAREYIAYCEQWTKLFHMAAKPLGNVVVDSEKDIKAFIIEFANGTKIHALSSNPKGFRSKGGKVVLDEFAHHDSQDQLWKAARPCVTWGFPLRILSTHNGQQCRFYKFIEQVNKGKLKWNLHTTPIQLAVDEGMVDKILQKKATEQEKEEWLNEQMANCFDEYTWLQEYCCVPIDEASAFLPYELISSCETENILKNLDEITGDLFVGMDIGRKKDLTVIWILEAFEKSKYTRMVKILEKTPFHIQEEVLTNILKHRNLRRCCIDSTGLGMQLAESAQRKFGQYRVEAINFTNKVKEELAYNLRTNFEDKSVFIPAEHDTREDLHSVRRITTSAGNIRFDADSCEVNGHADRFWALALALYAVGTNAGPINIASRARRESYEITKNY
ncbi:MAG: terminase family protein [Candidatus Gastranaerophilales bacterium]|nr:terminase family protein [Candidatus Gastranaerophilales bacterium]